jgi:hypothetical protein
MRDLNNVDPKWASSLDDLAKPTGLSWAFSVASDPAGSPFFDHVRAGNVGIWPFPSDPPPGEQELDRDSRDQSELLHQRVGHRRTRFVFPAVIPLSCRSAFTRAM